ncbi:TRAP transporter large permease [Halomonas sp. MCCC 1A11036]|uniref:TRAP transporter large permease protein n=1 Tax=Billgrantia zhangzhouensis TaxID=2733481 RepID=A0ABS9AK18_9GAMM|nr:TRAP transporter large permease [Halomonas zhangzhouensis]MCE8022083.1 TRAP transporter large permease [Halomonas zhangzhouensis]
MDPIILSALTVGLLLLLIFIGLPIAYSLAVSTLVMMIVTGSGHDALYIAEYAFQSLDSIDLVAVPMFIFMGTIIAVSPAGKDIYRALSLALPIPGGLGVASVGGCTIFSAMSGSSPATAAAIGSSAIPEMNARGYPPALACGLVVGGGTLGILTPPSIVLLLYGVVTGTSIGQLFMAGVVPAIMVAAMFSLYVVWTMWRYQAAHPEVLEISRRYEEQEGRAKYPLLRVLPFFLMVLMIMVALYGGWATPSELASVGAVASILLVLAIYRVTSFAVWSRLLLKTVRDTSMVLIIAAFAYYLGSFLSYNGAVTAISSGLLELFGNKWLTLLAVWLMMLVLGTFLPPFAIVVIVAPMFLPFVLESGFDPVWFGVLITLNMELGCITPPLGINLFVVKSIASKVSMKEIMLGSLPFFFILVFASLLLVLFPQIALWLPERMWGA